MTVLPKTTLCTIVRDELMNPAGGIKRFLESHVPYVEQAVIVDTGSADGTKEELNKLKEDFPQMKLYDYQFDNYADARNYSLSQVETPFVFVLDADELVTQEGFNEIRAFVDLLIKEEQQIGINFKILNISDREVYGATHNPRLFRKLPEIRYRNNPGDKSGENLTTWNVVNYWDCMAANNPIYHFLPESGDYGKSVEWYARPSLWGKAPSQVCPSFSKWKAFNPRRNEFK